MTMAASRSLLGRLDALTKLAFLLNITVLAFFIEHAFAGLALLLLLAVLALAARIRAKRVVGYFGYFAVLLMVIFLMTYYTTGDFQASVSRSLLVILKWLIVLLTTLLFVFTTNPQDLTGRLVAMGMPKSLAFVMGLTLRFFPFIRAELRRIVIAQEARGSDLRLGILRLHRIPKVVSQIFVPLMITLLRFSDEVTLSVVSRGVTIERYSQAKAPPLRTRDWVLISLNVVTFVAVIVLSL
ncbi:MAG: energy-coupling factor transporter transmembrane component T family protein [bacterium]